MVTIFQGNSTIGTIQGSFEIKQKPIRIKKIDVKVIVCDPNDMVTLSFDSTTVGLINSENPFKSISPANGLFNEIGPSGNLTISIFKAETSVPYREVECDLIVSNDIAYDVASSTSGTLIVQIAFHWEYM